MHARDPPFVSPPPPICLCLSCREFGRPDTRDDRVAGADDGGPGDGPPGHVCDRGVRCGILRARGTEVSSSCSTSLVPSTLSEARPVQRRRRPRPPGAMSATNRTALATPPGGSVIRCSGLLNDGSLRTRRRCQTSTRRRGRTGRRSSRLRLRLGMGCRRRTSTPHRAPAARAPDNIDVPVDITPRVE